MTFVSIANASVAFYKKCGYEKKESEMVGFFCLYLHR
jgi:hypothetical protein